MYDNRFLMVAYRTRREVDGVKEPKPGYLARVMQSGSLRARRLKLADRISNLTALGYVHDPAFVRKYVEETRACILPHASEVNPDMFTELSDLVESRASWLPAASAR